MKVYLVRKFYSFGQPKFIIYFYAKCGDLKHVNLDLIKNNEDIDNYFKSYYPCMKQSKLIRKGDVRALWMKRSI